MTSHVPDATLVIVDHLAALRNEGRLLLATARRGPGRTVPTCPGWAVRDVVRHVGQLYRLRAEQVRGRHQERLRDPGPSPQDDGALLAWCEDALAEIADVLAATDPAEPIWSWKRDDRTAGFWRRRMAHETAVHRVDVQCAFGDVTHVPDEAALDGIDEVLDSILVAFSRRDVGGDGRTAALWTGDRIWRVTPYDDRVDLDRAPGAAQATVTGEPSELFLWLWGRRPDESVTIEGAGDVARWPRDRIARLTG